MNQRMNHRADVHAPAGMPDRRNEDRRVIHQGVFPELERRRGERRRTPSATAAHVAEPEATRPDRITGWRSLSFGDRWTLIVTTLQAVATVTAALVALIGLWSVAPIITYYVAQQKMAEGPPKATVGATPPASSEVSEAFVADVLAWWTAQVRDYQRILELIGEGAERGLAVTCEVVQSDPTSGARSPVTSDLLIVTATGRRGLSEVVKVPVNEKAMPPAQYIQYRINHGAFSAVDPAKRQKVENAIVRYVQTYDLLKVPPPYVRPEMSPDEIRAEISLRQDYRRDAVRHVRALAAVIDRALEE